MEAPGNISKIMSEAEEFDLDYLEPLLDIDDKEYGIPPPPGK